MPKLGMQDIRKQQFVDAAITVIGNEGLARASNAKIANVAGLSASLLPHYFAQRELLLASILRILLRGRQRALLSRLKRCEQPLERLHALIDTYFEATLFTPKMKRIWHDLNHAIPQSAVLKRIYDAHQNRLAGMVLAEMRPLVSARTLENASIGFTALLDGLWIKVTRPTAGLAPSEAARLQKQYLTMMTTRIRIKAGDRLA